MLFATYTCQTTNNAATTPPFGYFNQNSAWAVFLQSYDVLIAMARLYLGEDKCFSSRGQMFVFAKTNSKSGFSQRYDLPQHRSMLRKIERNFFDHWRNTQIKSPLYKSDF